VCIALDKLEIQGNGSRLNLRYWCICLLILSGLPVLGACVGGGIALFSLRIIAGDPFLRPLR
ncbi:MAG: hypothetical protein ACI9JZ_002946, partial [Lentimonas sp.]